MKPRPIKEKAAEIIRFFRTNKRMPSYAEMAEAFGFSSKNAIFKLVGRLVEEGYLEKDNRGRLSPLPSRLGLPLLGSVQAGFPTSAEEELVDTLDLDEYLIENPEASFLLRVSGDSMIDAGIHQDDLAVIERGPSPKNGDIVLAEVDGDWTLKYFKRTHGSVELIPANKKYPPIRPRNELKVAGILRGVVRKY